jgi:hypothetical protein
MGSLPMHAAASLCIHSYIGTKIKIVFRSIDVFVFTTYENDH